MEENQKHACQTVRDPELCKWLETKGADLHELIVEVKLPLKKVTLYPGKHGRPAFFSGLFHQAKVLQGGQTGCTRLFEANPF